jgi:hypothetical protein
MKFQSVVTPDGFFAFMFEAVNGNRHDLHIFNESLLLPILQDLMPAGRYRKHDTGNGNHDDPVYLLYASPACPQSVYGYYGNQTMSFF